LHERVVELGVEVERLVRGDGPGRGGPDHRVGGLRERSNAERRGELVGLGAFEAHVQRGALFVLVFDFELGQRRAAVEAPIDGLQAAIDEAALHHALERADFGRLVDEVHGFVRVLPLPEHAQALEVGHLQRDLLGGKGAALGLHLVTRQVAAVELFDRVFDRQAVTVPAGDVLRVQALELARLDDHVLEDFVDRVADVDLAVGVGRAVVQHELGRTEARIAQLAV
jgi:hypothetical protein